MTLMICYMVSSSFFTFWRDVKLREGGSKIPERNEYVFQAPTEGLGGGPSVREIVHEKTTS